VRWLGRALGRRRAPRDADEALREAFLAVLNEDSEHAEAMLQRAVALDSEPVEAYLVLGRFYRSRGEIGRAIRIHQNLLLRRDLSPAQRISTLLELAADFQKGGFLRRAIASYEEVLAHSPRNATALRELVGLLASVREHTRAIALCQRLARVEGRDASTDEAHLLVEMGAAALAEGRPSDARRALKRALRRDTDCAPAWVALGALEAERGKARAAIDAWSRVPRIDRSHGPEVYDRLEASWTALGRPQEFERYLRELLEEQPEDRSARLALARALAARGNVEEALKEIRHELERDPDDLEAHCTLGRALLAERRDAAALDAYVRLLERLELRETPRNRELLD
jgi:lipopolysaccharide biosynthesis regulator YciM